jgi:hypothetical protein
MRHYLGAVVGLLAIPVIAAGLGYGTVERFHGTSQPTIDWMAIAAFAGTLILIGILVASRISPVASLLPGLAFTVFYGALLIRTGTGGDQRLGFALVPGQYLDAYISVLFTWSFPIGGILLAASAFPSRWRARPGRERVSEEEEPPPLPKRIPFASAKITSAKPLSGPATGP